MKNKRPAWISDFAKVTAYGILFQGCVYSSPRAIRERWFELAQLYGGWSIQVYFRPSNLKLIYIKTEEDDEVEECYVIENQMFAGSKLEKYFHSIQQLKRVRSQPSQTEAKMEIR